MTHKPFKAYSHGTPEAVIVLLMGIGLALHESVTNPLSPLNIVLWGITLVLLVIVLKGVIQSVLAFVRSIPFDDR